MYSLSSGRISIRTALTISFAGLILVAAGTAIYAGFSTGLKSTRDLTQEKTLLITQLVSAKIAQHLDPAEQAMRQLAQRHNRGLLNVNDPRQLEESLLSALAAVEQIESVLFVGPNMQALIVERADSETSILQQDWNGVPKLVNMVQSAVLMSEPRWGDLVHENRFHEPDSEATLMNIRMPLKDDGQFVGVFVASVQVLELARFVRELGVQDKGSAFLLYGEDQLPMHSVHGADILDTSAKYPLRDTGQITDPVLLALEDDRKSHDIDIVPSLAAAGLRGRMVSLGNETYIVMMSTLNEYSATPWTIGAYFPRDEISSEMIALRDSAVATLLVLVFTVGVAAWLSRRLSWSIQRLSMAAQELQVRHPAEVSPIPGSRITEMNNAANAFNGMLDGLANRELMRATFGKYVPSALAEKILKDGGVLAPEARFATIMFTDIVGFSSLAERMAPDALIGMLNQYFTLIAEPIERHGGVIQQFQGDGVLATFNLPLGDKGHARKAVLAAMEIQESLALREFTNGIRLLTRIGINTGDVVGGTVGSEGRLGYTVHGDAVNLASRVEQLNKQFATAILITEATASLVGDNISLREIGPVKVRGREQQVTLFSVEISLPQVNYLNVPIATI